MTDSPDETSRPPGPPDIIVGPPAGRAWGDLTDDEIQGIARQAAQAMKARKERES